jgi:hypothetical protein
VKILRGLIVRDSIVKLAYDIIDIPWKPLPVVGIKNPVVVAEPQIAIYQAQKTQCLIAQHQMEQEFRSTGVQIGKIPVAFAPRGKAELPSGRAPVAERHDFLPLCNSMFALLVFYMLVRVVVRF